MPAPAIGDEDGLGSRVQMKGISAMATDAMDEQLVGQADHLELARLVIEIAWRIDHGKAGTVHELFADEGQMNLGQTSLKAGKRSGNNGGAGAMRSPTAPGTCARTCASSPTVTKRLRAPRS
jgi:hypothetical protein